MEASDLAQTETPRGRGHVWTLQAVASEDGASAVGICTRCGLVRTAPATHVSPGELDLGGECPATASAQYAND